MTLAFANVFDDSIVQNIQDFIPEDQPSTDWETLYGKVRIYETDHYITYGGGPEGGYVYFYRERAPGWYYWDRGWFEKPTYAKIDTGQIVFNIDEHGSAFIARVSNNWEYEPDEDEVIILADDAEMQGRDD